MIGDVIPLNPRAFDDALELVRFAASNGFPFAAMLGLGRTFFSDYWNLREIAGLTRYDEAEMIARIEAAGFSVARAPTNIGHNAKRMTFIAQARERCRAAARHG